MHLDGAASCTLRGFRALKVGIAHGYGVSACQYCKKRPAGKERGFDCSTWRTGGGTRLDPLVIKNEIQTFRFCNAFHHGCVTVFLGHVGWITIVGETTIPRPNPLVCSLRKAIMALHASSRLQAAAQQCLCSAQLITPSARRAQQSSPVARQQPSRIIVLGTR